MELACSEGALVARLYFHHRMNLPNSVARHVLSPVTLIFRSMTYVPERFTDDSDDGRFIDVQLLGRASVKRKSRLRPVGNTSARSLHLFLPSRSRR
jgi:hypothetical protein